MKGVFMQCPNCDHEAPDSEFGNPLRCPSCGAYYEKALIAKQLRIDRACANAKVTEQEKAARSEQEAALAKKKELEDATLAKVNSEYAEAEQRFRNEKFEMNARLEKYSQETEAKRTSDAARSVIVSDIQMPFWSMVRFMVKSTLAAIPALTILLIFALIVMALFGKLR